MYPFYDFIILDACYLFINFNNMKKHLVILLLLAVTAISTFAQQSAQIKSAAQLMGKATINGDYKTIVKYTHPKLLAMAGGSEKMQSLIKQSLAEVKSQGVKIESVTMGEPTKVVTIGNGLYSTLLQTVVISSHNQKLSNTSTVLANSTDKGKNWTFVDAGGMSDEQLKQLFPEIAGKLKITKRTAPVPVK
jgi:hypothetical protein